MKGMNKISRGRNFWGVVKYAAFGSRAEPRRAMGVAIGGNMSSHAPWLVAKELAQTTRVRPDIKKPVWHSSLRLPQGEMISSAQWVSIADSYMSKMGFSDLHPRAYFLHNDPEGQHIHIIASRVSFSGNVMLGQNENVKSTMLIGMLESEYNLKPTKQAKFDLGGRLQMSVASRPKHGELQKSKRRGAQPERTRLQVLIREAISRNQTLPQFVEYLRCRDVDVKVNMTQSGRLHGFAFGLNELYFSGSKLGKDFTISSVLAQGLTYDAERDSRYLLCSMKRISCVSIPESECTAIAACDEISPPCDSDSSDKEPSDQAWALKSNGFAFAIARRIKTNKVLPNEDFSVAKAERAYSSVSTSGAPCL
jgi:hypothetical protein